MSHDDFLSQLKNDYLASFPAQIDEMEANILGIERNQQFSENFEALYRRVHSIKGSGGTFGFSIISAICHQMEDFISASLANSSQITEQAINIVFSYLDLLKETNIVLISKSNDFKEIEKKLANLKYISSSAGIKGIFIGVAKQLYSQICFQIFDNANIQYTTIESEIIALQRLIHEEFDFLVTTNESPELNGVALIAALKLNHGKNAKIKTILLTSNPSLNSPESLKPDYIVLKNNEFANNMDQSLQSIKKNLDF